MCGINIAPPANASSSHGNGKAGGGPAEGFRDRPPQGPYQGVGETETTTTKASREDDRWDLPGKRGRPVGLTVWEVERDRLQYLIQMYICYSNVYMLLKYDNITSE